jgi:disulfide bond formation protein DsbB
MLLARSRSLFAMGFIAAAVILGLAFYLEYQVGLVPCGLCLVQRVCVACFGAVCLLAALLGPARAGRRAYAALAFVFASAGALTASRQLWLQTGIVPSQEPCLHGMDHLRQVSSPAGLLNELYLGHPGCARINWTWLDMSLAEWSLLGFVALAALALFALLLRVP